MAYLATAGGGLVLGIVLLIWGLAQKNARHAAEREAAKAQLAEHAAKMAAANNAARAMELEAEIQRVGEQLALVRSRLTEAHDRLIKCEDPKTIKAWLDAELLAEEL